MSRGLRLLVATAAVATVAAAPCPPMAVTLKTNARAASTYPGKAVQLQARITNLGSAALTNVGVGFYLPNGVCTIRSALAPKSKTGVVPVVEGNNIYWEGLSLPAKKSIQIKLRGQISVGLTSGAALTVGAVGYLVGTNCTATAIPSKYQVAPPALPKAKRVSSPARGAVCNLNPVVNATEPYSPYAFNQRCAQAQLVSINRRRLEGPRSLYLDVFGQVRQLASLPSPDMCYQACSDLYGPNSTPFYANLYTSAGGSNACYCCKECTLVPDSGFTVYQVNTIAPKQCALNAVCAAPTMDQQPGNYATEFLCAEQCRTSDAAYTWMAFNHCDDLCFCSATCTGTTNEQDVDLYALDWQTCP